MTAVGFLLVSVAGVLGWRTSARGAGAALTVYPLGAATVLGSQVAVLVDGPARIGGLVVAVASAAWLSGARLGRGIRRPDVAVGDGDVARADGAPGELGYGFLGAGSWVVDFAPCERCGSVLVGSGRLDTGARDVVARCVCTGCGARLVGVESPDSPGRLVWFEQPEVAEDIA